MTTELSGFEKAAQEALAELEAATPSDTEGSSPEPEVEAETPESQVDSNDAEQAVGQPEEESVEQPETSDTEEEPEGEPEGEDEGLFADIEIEDEDAESPEPELSLDAEVEIPGTGEAVTLQELRDGYLRQADYTRKTQALAEERKQNERAVKLWEALQAEPQAVLKQLAVQAGFLDEDAAPVKAVEFSPITSQEEFEAELEKRVQEEIESHPDVVEARKASAWRTIHSEFDRIEDVFDVKLSDQDRDKVLREAKRRGVADLELVTQNFLSQVERKKAETQSLKDAAPARSSGRTTSEGKAGPATSFEEASQRALIELGMAD